MNPLLQSVQVALQNAEQKEAIDFIDRVVDFCVEHENGKVLAGWPEDLIQLLVAYHMAKDTFIVEQDDEGQIQGIFMWYNCDEEADWMFIQDWVRMTPKETLSLWPFYLRIILKLSNDSQIISLANAPKLCKKNYWA